MPLDLTTPIEVTSTKTEAAGRLRILSFAADYAAKRVEVVLAREDGGALARIPGMLAIQNVGPAGLSVTYGGKTFAVAEGTYFDDLAAGTATGATNFAVIKNGLYAMLGTMYGMAGTVS